MLFQQQLVLQFNVLNIIRVKDSKEKEVIMNW